MISPQTVADCSYGIVITKVDTAVKASALSQVLLAE